jgi:hypothetical protein
VSKIQSINTPTPVALRFSAHAILLAMSCNVAGWALSVFSLIQTVPLFVGIAAIWFLTARMLGICSPLSLNVSKWRRRFCQPLPFLFLFILFLATVGGLLYPPNNYDALNYRLPRVAHWLMAERWEWIHASNQNVNTRACGFEWLTVPLISVLHSDRPLFLINIICFCLLPSHSYGFMRGIGVAPRVARAWMWLLPAGYGFALQAASIGNDLTAAYFALASCHFALLWKQNAVARDLHLSLFAAGLMTAIKPTTLPILLPIAFLYLTRYSHLLSKPLSTLAVVVLGATTSFLPNAVINHVKGGDWTGAAIENPFYGKVEPLIGLSGNLINLALQNLAPPVFPIAQKWNSIVTSITPKSIHEAMMRNFESGGANFAVPDFQGEEWAGLGAALTILILASSIVAFHRNGRARIPAWVLCLWSSFIIAIIAYFLKAGMTTVGRHVLPYYIPLIAPLLLLPGHSALLKSPNWRFAATLVMLSTIGLTIITPSRPLWPANTAFERFASENASPFLRRIRTGYEVYGGRADVLGPLREALPTGAHTIGYVNFGPAPQAALWKPYLKRRLIQVLPGDPIEAFTKVGGRHIIINTRDFEIHMGSSPESWLTKHNAHILSRHTIRPLVKEPASEWWLVELP